MFADIKNCNYCLYTLPCLSRVYQGLLRLVKKDQDPASLVHKVALGRIEVDGLSELVGNYNL